MDNVTIYTELNIPIQVIISKMEAYHTCFYVFPRLQNRVIGCQSV